MNEWRVGEGFYPIVILSEPLGERRIYVAITQRFEKMETRSFTALRFVQDDTAG